MSSSSEIIYALRLINTPGVGPSSYFKLIENYGNEEDAVSALIKAGKNPWSEEQAQAELNACQADDIKIILYDDANYPEQLKKLTDYPPLLYIKGNPEALNCNRSVAIVGSRSASVNGCKIASRIAQELAKKNVCIISGMARGIDTAAHLGAMTSPDGQGSTIAVLGTGIDVIYPPENQQLYENIAINGCILSEFPLSTQGNAINFPRRNRLIAGLSQAVLVVEAGLKSGSLITAEHAMKQGKLLFAVPGTPDVSKSSGSNLLIKKGAKLADCAEDILPYLKASSTNACPKIIKPRQKVLVFANNDVNYSSNEQADSSLVDLLTVDGVDIDELIRLTGKPAATLFAEISELEINGIIRRLNGNRIALIK